MVEDRTSPDGARTAPDEINQTTSNDSANGETESAPVRPQSSEKATSEATTATATDPTAPNKSESDPTAPAAADATADPTTTSATEEMTGPNGAVQDATTAGANTRAVEESGAPDAAPIASAVREPVNPGDAQGDGGGEGAQNQQDAADDFGKQLEASTDEPRQVKVGERVRGKIVTIGEEHCFVDYKGRAEARIATSELRDRDGSVLMRVDDMITATVAATEDGVTLTLGKRRGPVNAARLRVSYENKDSVSGTVKSVNKGGFDVNVGGIRAFCPLSQVDNSFVDSPQEYVGKKFRFRVLRWENGGRNIVVSRRPILREESKQRASETRKHLEEGAELEGVVTRLQPFGAFVDLGGLEGLLHVSRMGHTRVEDPTAVVSKGDKVRVRVVHIENPGTRKERIALALIDLGPDPWATVFEDIKEGDVLSGTVARLAPFGAFVRLANGMDGLVHVSELSDNRVNEPDEAVTKGQEVQVRVLRIDVEKRRISLSLRLSADRPERKPKPRREPRPARGAPSQPKAGTAESGPVSLTHTMADQLGRLKNKLRDQG